MDKIGLYIHMPFCEKKCFYCDFNSYEGAGEYIDSYIDALIREVNIYSSKIKDSKITSIYIGGGTPSYIPSSRINYVLDAVFNKFDIVRNPEISIEANPGTLNKNKLIRYRRAGINRLSIGLQALQNKILSRIGRIHTKEDFLYSYSMARDTGFDNINIDLIFGIPTQKMEDWEESLYEVIKLEPEHISCYSLQVSENTPLYDMINSGQMPHPDEDLDRDMYSLVKQVLETNGYEHYEISNFCKKGRQCRHNLIYWLNRKYLGLGCSAHSYLFGSRFANTDSIHEYIQSLNKESLPLKFKEYVDLSTCINDELMLAMRLIRGVNRNIFKKHFAMPIEMIIPNETISFLEEKKLLHQDEKYISLTDKGMDIYNSVMIELLPIKHI